MARSIGDLATIGDCHTARGAHDDHVRGAGTRLLADEHLMALHYGRRTPVVTLVAHVAYGAVLGAFYHLARVG